MLNNSELYVTYRFAKWCILINEYTLKRYNEPWFQNFKYSEGFFYVEITQYFILKQC